MVSLLSAKGFAGARMRSPERMRCSVAHRRFLPPVTTQPVASHTGIGPLLAWRRSHVPL
tara:strand:- start:166 stop:342 length:177 start_codon:yes stop_codon:yes gene_type:complete